MIRSCPKRDAICPHGMDCPYSIGRYECEEIERPTLPTNKKSPAVKQSRKRF